MKKILAGSALILAGLGSAAVAAPMTLGDHYTLRAYTGQAVGGALSEHFNVNSLGVVVNQSSICGTLSGAMLGGFLADNRHDGAAEVAAIGGTDNLAAQIKPLLDQEAIALVFGGQVSPEENAAMVRATLAALAEADYQGAVLFHLAVWVPGMVANAASQDESVAQWLADRPNLFALAVNPEQGKALVHEVAVVDGEQRSTGIALQVEMEQPWLDLFIRSMGNR